MLSVLSGSQQEHRTSKKQSEVFFETISSAVVSWQMVHTFRSRHRWSAYGYWYSWIMWAAWRLWNK